MEQIYYIKENDSVPGTSIIRAKGYESREYIDDSQLLGRMREIAKINEENYCTALFVIC